ncbi:MAG: phospholipase D-like domain-containing protein [Cyclobacteriaceae bacterium]
MNIVYKNIQSKIAESIFGTNESILIAVAWFTNKELLSYLTEKAKNNCIIQLLISNDVINQRLNFEDFISAGGQLKIFKGERFLHEKFAVFDSKKVLVGSYNWTYGAEYKNHESLLLTDNEIVIKSYKIRFRNLWELAAQNIPFTSNNSSGFVQQENELKLLEDKLNERVAESIKEVKRLKIPINIDLVNGMIHRYGVIGACRKVLEKGNEEKDIPSGFYKLAEANKLDKTFEYLMTLPEYRILFPDKILELAEERLKKFSR